MNNQQAFNFRLAVLDDVADLLHIEDACFSGDRLSKRSFRRWVQAPHGILLVAESEKKIVGYGLVWCHKGTRLARLYSLAIESCQRGKGLAAKLLANLEETAARGGRLFMRLEVAENNTTAIQLYEQNGYRVFGEYCDYYDDHGDALRMQKTIQSVRDEQIIRPTPWYQQTTEFTCGPSALMMAMSSVDNSSPLNQPLELELWREATTIYMTSGHGGCHPVGLALSAHKRGFESSVYLNTDQPLFVSGVRSEHKKHIMEVVHKEFCAQALAEGVELRYEDITQEKLEAHLLQGWAVIILISTYRLDGKKSPHWVTVTSVDERCFYVHDPDFEDPNRLAIDCQHLPLSKDDFNKMSTFGSERLRAAVAIRPRSQNNLSV